MNVAADVELSLGGVLRWLGVLNEDLKAPFPYFGGKRRIAAEIWKRFGVVDNYLEPFFGSGAVLLSNPVRPKTETVCDKDHFIANFWRAVQADPETVVRNADFSVCEVELHVNHYWLITEGADRLRCVETDRHAYDAEVAGRWLWGICSWIGSGWCSGAGPWVIKDSEWVKEKNSGGDRGQGIDRKRPHLGDRGQGINRQLPHLGNRGRGINRPVESSRQEFIRSWIYSLRNRLRDVRISCGDWSRIVGPNVTHRLGITAVFLDPPYSAKANRMTGLYRTDCESVAVDAAEWALKAGQHGKMRIAFAGYEGEHDFPGWERLNWKTRGGYGSQSDKRGRENASREMLWFSPHCLKG